MTTTHRMFAVISAHFISDSDI